MTNPSDPHFQWTQAIHRDLVNLRDNHLAHIQEDLSSLKSDMKEVRRDVDDLKEVKDQVQRLVGRISFRLLLAIVATIGTVFGLPVAMEGM